MRSGGSDYMSKLSYQESLREQMAVTNPNTTGLKTSGMKLYMRSECWVFYSLSEPGYSTLLVFAGFEVFGCVRVAAHYIIKFLNKYTNYIF